VAHCLSRIRNPLTANVAADESLPSAKRRRTVLHSPRAPGNDDNAESNDDDDDEDDDVLVVGPADCLALCKTLVLAPDSLEPRHATTQRLVQRWALLQLLVLPDLPSRAPEALLTLASAPDVALLLAAAVSTTHELDLPACVAQHWPQSLATVPVGLALLTVRAPSSWGAAVLAHAFSQRHVPVALCEWTARMASAALGPALAATLVDLLVRPESAAEAAATTEPSPKLLKLLKLCGLLKRLCPVAFGSCMAVFVPTLAHRWVQGLVPVGFSAFPRDIAGNVAVAGDVAALFLASSAAAVFPRAVAFLLLLVGAPEAWEALDALDTSTVAVEVSEQGQLQARGVLSSLLRLLRPVDGKSLSAPHALLLCTLEPLCPALCRSVLRVAAMTGGEAELATGTLGATGLFIDGSSFLLSSCRWRGGHAVGAALLHWLGGRCSFPGRHL
jgi:hypothetical protein